MTAFAASALLLAALGIYGVVAFSVNQRNQEFGVRAALGAMPREILAVAVRPGLTLAAAGAVAGLFVAWRSLIALVHASPRPAAIGALGVGTP